MRDTEKRPWPGWPVVGKEERNNLLQAFDSGEWWFGDKVKEFESAFAAFQDARFGVSCTTGTAAIELGLRAAGVQAGDEVIVPSYTFIATAGAAIKLDAVPVFADIELDTGNLDPRDAAGKITDKTTAIVPVHLAGLPVDMDAINALADEHGLKVVEDACHSWGSRWRGKGTGALGACGAFSFQISKNITAGEGGILLTDDEDIAGFARSYRNCGRLEGAPWYEHSIPADNLRMTELQAAILLGQLTRLEEQTNRRQENARILDNALKNIPGIAVFQQRDPRVTRRAYHYYMVRYLEDEWDVPRDRFIAAAQAEGLPIFCGYGTPLNKNPLFLPHPDVPQQWPSAPLRYREVGYSGVTCPQAEKLCRQALWTAHQLLLGDREDMQDIISIYCKLWDRRTALKKA